MIDHSVESTPLTPSKEPPDGLPLDVVIATDPDVAFCFRLAHQLRFHCTTLFIITSIKTNWHSVALFDRYRDWLIVDEACVIQSGRCYFVSNDASVDFQSNLLVVNPEQEPLSNHTCLLDSFMAIQRQMISLGSKSFSSELRTLSPELETLSSGLKTPQRVIRNLVLLQTPASQQALCDLAEIGVQLWLEHLGQLDDKYLPNNVTIVERQNILTHLLGNETNLAPYREALEPLPDVLISQGYTLEKQFLVKIAEHTQVDFLQYRQTFLTPHIQQRCRLLDKESILEYANYCVQHPEEYIQLQDSLFKCYPQAEKFSRYRSLFMYFLSTYREELLITPTTSLKCWVAGCGMGEESYALACAIIQLSENANLQMTPKLFVTDIYQPSLDFASHKIPQQHSNEPLDDQPNGTWLSDGDDLSAIKQARSHMVFTQHDLLKDPPISQVNLIVCCHTLTLFKESAKRNTIRLFNSALMDNGFLLLSEDETFDLLASGFVRDTDRPGLYRKVKSLGTSQSFQKLPDKHQQASKYFAPPLDALLRHHKRRNRYNHYHAVMDQLIDRRLPAGMLIDQDFKFVHVFSDISPYVEPMKSGKFSTNLKHIIKPGLKPLLLKLLSETMALGKDKQLNGVPWTVNGVEVQLTISVHYLREKEANVEYYALLFEQSLVGQSVETQVYPGSNHAKDNDYARTLEEDLQNSRRLASESEVKYQHQLDEINKVNSQLIINNEQLQLANEHLSSYNEALQNTFDDIQQQLDWIEALNNQLPMAIAVIDKQLCLNYFNQTMTRFFPFTAADEGHKIDDVKALLADVDWISILQRVSESRVPSQIRLSSSHIAFFWPLNQTEVMMTVPDTPENTTIVEQLKTICYE